jgi:hypothetical protein
MIAYKFLRLGAVAPFAKVTWPRPGAVEPGWVPDVHACRVADLPLWIFDELWEVELDGPIEERPTHVSARAGRLRAPVEAWNARTAVDFAVACAERTHALAHEAFALDADTWAASAAKDERIASADAACVAYIAAHAAGELRGPEAAEHERAWQADWLTRRLGLV